MRNLLSYLVAAIVILTLASPIVLIEKFKYKTNFSGFQNDDFILPFEIMNPDSVYVMPKELKEISGLSHYRDMQFFTVNDEKGNLYLYDLSTGTIIAEVDFGKRGDYEAVTRNNNIVYVAESNGNVKVIDYQRRTKISEFNSSLSKKNDVEGLSFDAENNWLLFACKGKLENKDKKTKNAKGIYYIDLNNRNTDIKEYKIINLEQELDSLTRFNLFDNFINNTNTNSRIRRFAPSGMSYDPITGYLYILANRGKILVVLDKEKDTKGIYFLSHRIFGQPEGISFDKDGNLYISNESKSTKANIIQFLRNEKKRVTLEEVLDMDISIIKGEEDSTEVIEAIEKN
jgi:uncharacterized protein YjiK